MDKKYRYKDVDKKIYEMWEKKKYFKANPNSKKRPFCIILPPPNANANLHLGHAMYVYEDIMIRFYKLRGFESFWLPGADHAGFETWYVFEKHLKKKGKSRFDYKREELFKMVWEFVMQNKNNMEEQLKRLGFSLDWERKKFTLDEDIVQIVYKTFKKLFDDNLVYRGKKLVNYCVKCGTSFSDLEVTYKDVKGKLWFILYKLENSDKGLVVATTRPETLFGDVAVAVHPDDKRYKKFIGKKVILPFINKKIPVIADEMVDMKFGTGVVKITPAHDSNDWLVGERHNLPFVQVIDFNGKLNEHAGEFSGLHIKKARPLIVQRLEDQKLLVKVKDYEHRVGHCYKCGSVIEPLPKEQWFIKIKPLAQKAKDAILKDEIEIYPHRFKKILLDWLDKFYDWNISRQIVWGMQIPAYFCKSQKKWFVSVNKPSKCLVCGKDDFVQDTDTFDTWFSSGQWPFATLQALGKEFFNFFYPTSVMETGYDILPWWVARMIMFGIYITGSVPFKNVYLHGLVRDSKGQKMSKSKGNVVNPMDVIDKYGADALRASLVFETAQGGDVVFSDNKVRSMRNFANKIWNIGRFIYLQHTLTERDSLDKDVVNGDKHIKDLEKESSKFKKRYMQLMEKYKFGQAFDELYEFVWHRVADYYIEQLKESLRSGNIEVLERLTNIYFELLKMLHPFMPFVTEAVWMNLNKSNKSILETTL